MSDDPVQEAMALLMRRRDEAAQRLADIDAAIERLAPPTPPSPPRTLTIPQFGSSLRDQILAAIPDARTYSADEIVAAVDGQEASVRSTISRLAKAGDLHSPARGQYQRADLVAPHVRADEREEVSGETDESGVLPNVTQDDRLT